MALGDGLIAEDHSGVGVFRRINNLETALVIDIVARVRYVERLIFAVAFDLTARTNQPRFYLFHLARISHVKLMGDRLITPFACEDADSVSLGRGDASIF